MRRGIDGREHSLIGQLKSCVNVQRTLRAGVPYHPLRNIQKSSASNNQLSRKSPWGTMIPSVKKSAGHQDIQAEDGRSPVAANTPCDAGFSRWQFHDVIAVAIRVRLTTENDSCLFLSKVTVRASISSRTRGGHRVWLSFRDWHASFAGGLR
jgi:hypothetical protein